MRAGVVRTGLVVLAVALVAIAYLSTRSLETRSSELAPRGGSGVVVVDLSLSIVEQDYVRVRDVLRRLIRSGNPSGLVIFSDTAYELLPPRTPVSELEPLLRYFTPRRGRLLPNPWQQSFQAGTRISEALDLAHRMLRRDRVARGSILLVSDLATSPDDYTTLSRVLLRLRASDVSVRVTPLSPASDAMQLFESALGREAFVDVVEPRAVDPGPVDLELYGDLPIALIVATALALLALAGHELFAGRLALPAGAGRRET
jgi:hypothetical protein